MRIVSEMGSCSCSLRKNTNNEHAEVKSIDSRVISMADCLGFC